MFLYKVYKQQKINCKCINFDKLFITEALPIKTYPCHYMVMCVNIIHHHVSVIHFLFTQALSKFFKQYLHWPQLEALQPSHSSHHALLFPITLYSKNNTFSFS